MPLHTNVNGVIKTLSSLHENVGGVIKKFSSYKENAGGVFKELLQRYVAKISGVRAGGSNVNQSSTPFSSSLESGDSYSDSAGSNATGVTGYSYFTTNTFSVTPLKTCTLKFTGTYSGSGGSLSVKINDTELVTKSPVSISKTVYTTDVISIRANASWGYQSGGKYDFALTIT